MAKSAGQNQVTLKRTNKEQGCLSLSYLSEGPNIDDANFTPPSAKKKNNWKLKISWAGMFTNKNVDWFVWLIFKSRFRNFIIEVLNNRYHSYPYGFKRRSKAISTFSLLVKFENLELHYFLKMLFFYRCYRLLSNARLISTKIILSFKSFLCKKFKFV